MPGVIRKKTKFQKYKMIVRRHKRKSKLKFSVIPFFFMLICQICEGQRLLPDTIDINFRADSIVQLNNLNITEITDKRNENPRFIRYGTKNKFLLIPVDQEFYTKEPLADEIARNIVADKFSSPEFLLAINKFEVEKQKGRISSTTFLSADLILYERKKDSMIYRGTFFYDYPYRREGKKETMKQESENLLGKWHRDFKIDLMTVNAKSTGDDKNTYTNFINDTSVQSLYLNIGGGLFAGLNWWGFQAEIFFTRPETRSNNHYWAGIIRYNNNEDYESFAIGRKSEHYYFRRNEKLLFDVDLNILIGFCKWRNVDEGNIKLYQVVDFELSSIQCIQYNPVNSKGFFFKAGFMENLLYVIDKKPKFQLGTYLGVGLKL